MFRHRPAMRFVVPFALGAALGEAAAIPILPALGVAAALFLSSLLLERRTVHAPAAAILFALGVTALGSAKIACDARLVGARDVSHAAAPGRAPVVGRLGELPRLGDRSIRFIVDVESVAHRPADGRLLLVAARTAERESLARASSYGTRLEAFGAVELPSGPRNPGEFDRAASLRLNDVTAEMHLGVRDALRGAGREPGSILDRMVWPVRASVNRVLGSYFAGEEARFLKGLITGERSEITPELKEAFITSGVMHIVAVSGLHVVIVTMMLTLLLEALRVPPLPRLFALTLLLAWYTFFTGATASVARSVLMALVLLWAPRAGRRADIYNALAFSAIVVLFADARQLFQPGFQLSYAAVLSLVYLGPKVTSLGALFPDAWRRNRAARFAGEGLAVSLAAGVGTIPFGAAYFGKVSVVSLVANIVVVPLSNVVLALGMLTVALAYLWPWLAGVYAGATSLATWLLLRSVELFAAVPHAAFQGSFGPAFHLCVYAALAFLLNMARPERRSRTLLAALALCALLAWVWACAPTSDGLELSVIDVGQGDAILVRFPGGKTLLVDAGPRSAAFDAGARTVAPYLRYRGVGPLDAFVLTHPHGDHIGGAAAVLGEIGAQVLIEGGATLQGSVYRMSSRAADSAGSVRRIVRSGETIDVGPQARCYVLAPLPAPGESAKAPAAADGLDNHGLNDRSVVLRIVYGRTSVLLSGDAEAGVEEALVRRYGSFLASDVLKTGHHGSRTSSSAAYLAAVRPRIALVSVGARNTFGHPSPEVVARLDASAVRVARTDREGAILMASDGESWRRLDWR